MDIKIYSTNTVIDEDLLYGTLQTNYYSYEGQIQNEKPHGVGRIIWYSGNIYEGQLNQGIMQGYGRIIYHSNDDKWTYYIGQF